MSEPFDLVCFSHLRWDFIYQRPQHLLSRAARERRVFYVEEPTFGEGPARFEVEQRAAGLWIAVPRLPVGLSSVEAAAAQRPLLDALLAEQGVADFVLWYYTPMALEFSRHLRPLAVVYDCMDELSAFKEAPPGISRLENELFGRADVVFTGGRSLYEAKRDRHPNLHALPSGVDRDHFMTARAALADPADQSAIPHPRVGFFGVIDERLDASLVDGVAALRPDLSLIMVGPVVKIDPAQLPRRPNIHWLGAKSYAALPAYISGWDVAMLPFARNESTRFISPTKTPEYLAAGKPVVSTSIRDVVRPYGEEGLARIADTPDDLAVAIVAALAEEPTLRNIRADVFLARMSWDSIWGRMMQLTHECLARRPANVSA